MNSKVKILICLTVFYFLSSCNEGAKTEEIKSDIQETEIVNKYQEIKEFEWLVGSWHGDLPQIKIDETWAKENDSTFLGTCVFTKLKDTLSSEKIKLAQNQKGLFYIPTVKEQNQGKAIDFLMTITNENGAVFENAAHDFPQKINYIRKKPDSLIVVISGTIEGKTEEQKFLMRRIK